MKEEAFSILFKHSFELHVDELHRYAFTILKSDEKAKDAVQQVFIKWWNQENRESPANVRAYLYTSVYNYCLNEVRNVKVREKHLAIRQQSLSKHANDVEEKLLAQELQTKIDTAIAELPAQCKRIFQMSRFEDKRYQEIAQELNLSIKTIEVQMGKALKYLRSQLSEYIH